MAVRTATHLAHLTSKSYAEHMALAEFYEALPDIVDRYAEAYMAEHDIPSFPSITPPRGAPISILTAYLELVRDELEEDENERSETAETILADIEELTLGTLYKLKNLR